MKNKTPTPRGSPTNTVDSSNGDSVSAALKKREARYGDFSNQAVISENLLYVLTVHGNWDRLTHIQREAIRMITNKLARILNGDPNYADSWIDIAGYAKLVADRLQKENLAKNV
jgi:uncharacterized protein DUF6378